MSRVSFLLLVSVLILTIACKKEQATEATAQTELNEANSSSNNGGTTASTSTIAGESQSGANAANSSSHTPQRKLTPEEQAEETYSRARKLSESTQGGFVNNPSTFHEKTAARFIKRMQIVMPLTEKQQNEVLVLTQTYPKATIKGKAGKAKREEIMERAYREILTEEQRSAVDRVLPDKYKN